MRRPLQPWSVLNRRTVIADKWLTLHADRCLTPQGVTVDPYYVQEGVDWCNVAAFDDEFRILLVEQYRHGLGEVSLEIPAGCVELGEDPAVAIQRELREETGCTVRECIALPPQHPNPARQRNTVFPFLALGTQITLEQRLDIGEDIQFRFVPLPELFEMIDAGVFKAAIHLSNILVAVRVLVKKGLVTL